MGQKNKPTRRWARRGTRPAAPQDQRPFGAVPRTDLPLWCDLPKGGQGCGSGAAPLQPRRHDPAPRRDRSRGGAQCTCRAPARSSGMAPVQAARRSAQHHPRPAAAEVPRTSEAVPRSRSKTSGSSCARTGSRTGSSAPTTTSSTIAATRGTSSSTSPGPSCPSECATGRMGPDQRDLV